MSALFKQLKHYLRIRYILKCCYFYVRDRFGIKHGKGPFEKVILIVKTDAIGDYLLFRNLIFSIKHSSRFKDYKIYLCANELYKDLSEHFDSKEISNFIWFNRKTFVSDAGYRNQILRKVNSLQVEYVIQPCFSREFLIGDAIARAANADKKITAKSNSANDLSFFLKISDTYYSEIYETPQDLIFEFDKNKNFIEHFIGEKIPVSSPFIAGQMARPKEEFVVIFPGAGEIIKQWPPEKFAETIAYIDTRYKRAIKICGSSNDKNLAETIIALSGVETVKNECGNTDLVQLVNLIQRASLLITNDSSALHIAACVNTQTICLLTGRHYGRFAPYTDQSITNLNYVYPKKFRQSLADTEKDIVKATRYISLYDISTIEVEEVIARVDAILSS